MKKEARLIQILSVFVLTGFLLSQAALAKDARDWPTWRGPNVDGSVNADVFKGEFGLKIAWKKTLGSGYSSITTSGKTAVTMFSDSTFDYVVALNIDDGKEKWRFKLDSTYVGHNGSHNGPISTAVIDDKRVFALGPKGQLLALNLKNGKEIWSTNLVEDHNSIVPFYGFTTAPLVYRDRVIVEVGGSEKNTISALNKKNGKVIWSAGSDTVHYQSPTSFEFNNETHIVCSGDNYLCGFDPKTGRTLWKYHHNTNLQTINPVYLADGKLFFGARGRQSVAIALQKDGDMYQAKELWNSNVLRRSFNPAVLHEGVLYGYSGRFLAAIDAETGERVYKSRPPGDGFTIVVDGHLVVLTKQGTLHVSKAERAGYEELASLQVFDNLTWTPPSFARGRIIARSLRDIAAVDIVPKDQVVASELPEVDETARTKGMAPAGSAFSKFITELVGSTDKKGKLDRFMAGQKSFPIIEGNEYAHVIYRGEAKDVAVSGDLLEVGAEEQLQHVEGTDLRYYSFKLKPDARINYRLNVDLNGAGPDPLNKREPVNSVFGPSSELAMPDWQRPAHLNEPGGVRGQVDSLTHESKILNNSRIIDVYLPVGYEDSGKRYPTIYVNYGRPAQQNGILNTLDNLMGKTIEPAIVVLIDAPRSGQEYARQFRDQYAQMVAEEIVPMIDEKYRTLPDAKKRAFMGADEGGYAAIYTTLKHPGLFGRIGGQSTHALGQGNGGDELRALIDATPKTDVQFYLEWGSYEYYSTSQNFDWAQLNMDLVKQLRGKGYAVDTGLTSEGWGWASWRNTTDKVLEALFPLKSTKK